MMGQEKRKKITVKKCSFYVLLFLIFYIGSYSVLSFFGSYNLAKSGNFRFKMGWSSFDMEIWYPKIGYACIYRKLNRKLTIHADSVGLFYCPLILLDQKYIHKTRYFNEEVKQEHQELILDSRDVEEGTF